MRYLKIPSLAIACILGAVALAQSVSLTVERHGDYLHVAAPQLHFLSGKALEKLHNGASVAYVITLAAIAEHSHTPAFQLQARFAISFDLWEEKYSVVQTGPNGRAASRLTAPMAEAWCLENMPLPVQAVPALEPFVIRLECSIDEVAAGDGSKSSSMTTLARLIDVFSRRSSEKPLRWEAATGPLRLADLKSVKQAR